MKRLNPTKLLNQIQPSHRQVVGEWLKTAEKSHVLGYAKDMEGGWWLLDCFPLQLFGKHTKRVAVVELEPADGMVCDVVDGPDPVLISITEDRLEKAIL